MDLIEGRIYNSNRCGQFKIIKYHNVHSVDVEFVDTGYCVNVSGGSIRSGSVKDKLYPSIAGVGYVGVGPHIAGTSNNKVSEAYSIFKDMMYRCYNPKAWIKNPGYSDVSVCEEWHNFQNFAQWFEDNKPDDWDTVKYHLDKDVINPWAKQYRPDTCCFIPAKVNVSTRHKTEHVGYVVCSPSGEEHVIYAQLDLCKLDSNVSRNQARRICKGGRSKSGWSLIKEIYIDEYEHLKEVQETRSHRSYTVKTN